MIPQKPACVVGDRHGVTIIRRLGRSPVNCRSSAPPWGDRDAAVETPFAGRISRCEFEFAQQNAQGDVHFRVRECRTDAAEWAAAERNPRVRLGDGGDESVG
jgi:hypothetical protein